MAWSETIRSWIQRPQALDQLPFELLVEEHAQRSQEVQDVFVRRLYALVFEAAQIHLRDRGDVPTEEATGSLCDAVFTQFATEFSSGQPETILVRFASTIVRSLGKRAFDRIAPRYYAQLIIYRIKNDEQRRILAAVYEHGVSPSSIERLAYRFGTSPDRCKAILTQANASYRAVIEKESSPEELRRSTDGFIS